MGSLAAASAWGLLRNAFQEYPAPKYSGLENDPMSAMSTSMPATDSFGIAIRGGSICQPKMLPLSAVHQSNPQRPFSGEDWAITGDDMTTDWYLASSKSVRASEAL